MTEKDLKRCFSVKKLISTSKRPAEHQLAGQNTHQTLLLVLGFNTPTLSLENIRMDQYGNKA